MYRCIQVGVRRVQYLVMQQTKFPFLLNKQLSKKDSIALFAAFPFKPARFYCLPKIHKPVNADGTVKGRPIVSCIDYCTSPASKFIDHHIKDVVECHADTVLRDTSQLIDSLVNITFPPDCRLITADVSSLYTNMDWESTLAAMNTFLSEFDHPLCSLLVDLTKLVLENNFYFKDHVYHQQYGMAMGTPMAVNVANMFLYVSERKSVANFKDYVPFLPFCR